MTPTDASAEKPSTVTELLRDIFSDNAVRGLVFLALVVTVCYMAISGRPVSTEVHDTLYLVVGYYFGTSLVGSVRRDDLRWPTKP